MGDVRMQNRRKNQRGNAIIEAALLMPWLFFLFAGVFDMGFFSYEAICLQNAARAAAMATSKDVFSATPTNACKAALPEMVLLINMTQVTCTTSPTFPPFSIAVTPLNCTTNPPCADCTAVPCANPNYQPQSVQATVTYQMLAWIPIPGLNNQLTLSRTTEMRVIE